MSKQSNMLFPVFTRLILKWDYRCLIVVSFPVGDTKRIRKASWFPVLKLTHFHPSVRRKLFQALKCFKTFQKVLKLWKRFWNQDQRFETLKIVLKPSKIFFSITNNFLKLGEMSWSHSETLKTFEKAF